MNGQQPFTLHVLIKFVPFSIMANRCQLVIAAIYNIHAIESFVSLIFPCIFLLSVPEQCENVNGNQKDDSGPGTLLWLSSSPNASLLHHQSAFVQRTGSVSYNIETAFEVRVRTQSLCVADQTMNINETLAATDDVATTSETTSTTATSRTNPTTNPFISIWTTKEAGACVLSAVLLKLTPLTTDAKKIE